MIKKFTLTVLSYIIVSFAIAYPWHFVWFKDLYHSFGIYNKAEPIFPLGLTAMLLQGLILAYMFRNLPGEKNSISSGIKYGLLMGIFLFSVSTLANAAKIEVYSLPTFVSLQLVFHCIQFAVFGAVSGFIYRGSRDQLRGSLSEQKL